MSAAKGKISRLSFAIRQDLCRRMRDGVPDGDILEWLNGIPEVAEVLAGKGFGGRRKARGVISPQNMSEYRRPGGPFDQWAKEQERVESVKELAEFSMRMAEAAGGDVNSTAVAIMGGKMLMAIETAPDEDRAAIADALARLNKSEADKMRARTGQDMLSVRQQQLSLDLQRFERQTAELFLKWYADKRAHDIVDSKAEPEAKISQLRAMMFGAVDAKPVQGDTP